MSDSKEAQSAKRNQAEDERSAAILLTQKMKADIADWVAQHGIKFTYIRNPDGGCKGGATIAWAHPNGTYENFRLLRVSIAWCAPGEPFNRTLGRWVAAKSFLEGHWTNIRIENPRSQISSQLQDLFINQI